MVQVDPTVAALQQAAQAIASERIRLNNTFDMVQAALKAYMPSVKLLDDGTVVDVLESDKQQPPIDEEAAVRERERERAVLEAVRERARDEATLAAQREESSQRRKVALQNDKAHLQAVVGAYIKANSPVRTSKVESEFMNAPMPNGTVVTTTFMHDTLTGLKEAQIIKRERDGRLVHRDWSPKVDVAPPLAEPEPSPVDAKRYMRHAYPTGGEDTALCGFKRGDAINITGGNCPDCKRIAEEQEATPPPADVPPAPGVAENDDGTYGLAHTPAPRDQLKKQIQVSEARLDHLVRWLAEQPTDIYDSGTALFTLKTKLRGEKGQADQFHDPVNGWFGNSGQAQLYFTELTKRGVLVKTNEYYHPPFKDEWEKKGRTTPIYRRGPNFPKADPAPPTQESVRETVPTRASGDARSTPGASNQAASTPSRPPVVTAPTPEAIRDAAITWCKLADDSTVTIAQIIDRGKFLNSRTTRAIVAATMANFVNKGWFRNGPTTGSEWVYIPVTDEGAAARIDRQRRPAAPEREAVTAVAGTGSGIRVGNKDVQNIVRAAINKWGKDAVQELTKHIRVNLPDGTNVTIAKTPNQRGLLRDKSRLRKAGLALA